MAKIDLKTLKAAANNLMFDMEAEQYQILIEEFDTLIKQIYLLDQVPNVNNVDVMDFPFEVERDILRDDIPAKPLPIEEILDNAGDTYANQIKVPKVVK